MSPLIDTLELKQEPNNKDREHALEFLRHGLTNSKLIKAGNIGEVAEAITRMFDTFKADLFLTIITRMSTRMFHDETFGSVELYENGINAYVREKGKEHATTIFRWRIPAP